MRRIGRDLFKVLPVVSALVLPACADTATVCSAGLPPRIEAQLFFGDHIAGGTAVGPAQWQEFVDSEVTPRFPSGFTILATTGQWRGDDVRIVRESGHELLIVFARTPGEERKLSEIRTAYMQQFMQESVVLAESSVCASF